MARVDQAVVTDLEAERPADFDLATAWDQVVGELEQRRSLVPTRLVSVLRTQFGLHCQVQQELEDGRSVVRLAAPTPLMIAQYLAGWGALLKVRESAAVRAELARLGAELVERHAT